MLNLLITIWIFNLMQNDKLELLKPGSLQHLGENMLSFLIHSAASPHLPKGNAMEQEENKGQNAAIYFDILVPITADFYHCYWLSTLFLPSFSFFFEVYNVVILTLVAISGDIYGCIQPKFRKYALQFSNNTITSHLDCIIAYGWLSCRSFIGPVMFEHYPYVDIGIRFFCTRCIYSSLSLFITTALCRKPMVGSWVICCTCSSWRIDWSTLGLSFSSNLFVHCIFQEKATVTCNSSWLDQVRVWKMDL